MRLIDADALKKAMDRYWGTCQRIRKPRNGETAVFLDVRATVEKQPTVDAAPQWIPCCENLPPFPRKSLWVNEKGNPTIPQSWKPLTLDDGPWQEGYIVCSKSGKVFYSTWYASDKSDTPHWTTKAEITAWMPMPKPFKAERKEEW